MALAECQLHASMLGLQRIARTTSRSGTFVNSKPSNVKK